MAKAREAKGQVETAWHAFFRRVRDLAEQLDAEEQARSETKNAVKS